MLTMGEKLAMLVSLIQVQKAQVGQNLIFPSLIAPDNFSYGPCFTTRVNETLVAVNDTLLDSILN